MISGVIVAICVIPSVEMDLKRRQSNSKEVSISTVKGWGEVMWRAWSGGRGTMREISEG